MTLPAAPMSVVPEEPTPPPGRSGPLADLARRLADLALRGAGGLIAALGGALIGVLELLFAVWAWEVVKGQPNTSSAVLIGLSLALGGLSAVVAVTVAVSSFAHAAVGSRWAAALPAVPWFVLIFVAARRTTEGDLLIGGDNLIGLSMIVTGAITFAVTGFRQMLASAPVRRG